MDLLCKLKALVKAARLNSVDDTGPIRRGEVTYMGHTGVPVMLLSPYGLAHNPPASSFVLLLSQNGQESNAIGIAEDPNERPRNLATGEAMLYNQLTGDFVHMKTDGTIAVKSGNSVDVDAPEVTMSGNLTIAGNVSIGGNVEAVNGTFSGTVTTAGLVFSSATDVSITGNIIVTSGDVTADGISLKTHTHDENGTGGGVTDPPNP